MYNAYIIFSGIRFAYDWNHMELRSLKYFLAVAREENMTEAANVLRVTQPTLSRQVADLERELGCELFTRTNRSMLLTEEGMRLRQRAEEIIALVDQTVSELADRTGELAGNIRIGAGETQAVSTLARTFASMRRDHPQVTCELFTGNADTVEERLERGLLDFALLLEPVKLEKYEWLRLPGSDRSGVVVSADGKWADLKAVTPEVLAKMPLLASSRTTNRDFDFEKWSDGRLRREDLDIVGTHDLTGNATWLVKEGDLCATSIDQLLHLNDDSLRFIPLDPPVEIASYVVWKKYRLRSHTCEEFLKRLQIAAECGSVAQ